MTLGAMEKHYRVCLNAEVNGLKNAAIATLLHSQLRPIAVRGLLASGVKNAQFAPAAREHLDRMYRTAGHRAATDGIPKGISVCCSLPEAPERPPSALVPTEPGSHELQWVPLAALKGEHAGNYLPLLKKSIEVANYTDIHASVSRFVRKVPLF